MSTDLFFQLFSNSGINKTMEHVKRNIMIVSADPELAKVQRLMFELQGFAVQTKVNFEEVAKVADDIDVLIIDIAENKSEQWQIVRRVLAKNNKKGTKCVIILPHGYSRRNIAKGCETACLVVRRPYELLNFVRQVKEI